jgi:hypothetical protein
MRILITTVVVLTTTFVLPPVAGADWRWADPPLKKHTVKYTCSTMQCIQHTYTREKHRFQRRVERYNQRRLREWKQWINLFIPSCTWYGESGAGPEFARFRYTVPNSQGSGAYGKYQMMPGTYHGQAKYHDWSALDQEIAGHRLYQTSGIGPWEACK